MLATTQTHWRAAGVHYAWPSGFPLVVDLWVPLGQDPPELWLQNLLSAVATCDSCGANPPLRYSHPHFAHFCPDCFARENP